MTFSRIPSTVPISEPQPFILQKCLALSFGGSYRLQYKEHVGCRQCESPEQSSVPYCRGCRDVNVSTVVKNTRTKSSWCGEGFLQLTVGREAKAGTWKPKLKQRPWSSAALSFVCFKIDSHHVALTVLGLTM